MTKLPAHPASFRDNSGFVFAENGTLYRQVNNNYKSHYELLLQSGLYEKLIAEKALVAHEEVSTPIADADMHYKTLRPELLPFISYPYEWSFDQLKDAALLTLSITKTAIEHGMILKDATAYNVSFKKGQPIFIDTLSFETYNPELPWIAYRQFCQHFLYPLFLEHYCKIPAIQLLSVHLDGIPAAFAAPLMPWKAKWNLGVRLHLLLQQSVSGNGKGRTIQFSKQKMLQLLSHLESVVRSLKAGYPEQTTWNNYYEETILGKDYLHAKAAIMKNWLSSFSGKTIVDFGANDGYFSQLAASYCEEVIAADFDASCINRAYLQHQPNIYPIVLDLTNPSPAIGFNNEERSKLSDRVNPQLSFALALVHHLAIAKNIPLASIASFFHSFEGDLIIEWVPKSDEKVKQLLSNREDIFDLYTQAQFELQFANYYTIEKSAIVPGTDRILYSLKRK